ncbi:uncharacterized protein LOC119102725 [Pollicipes pollicipes]|uniref:uncharacterized protein LOC119102725 n=1 Tax=Pollicipes pollicipes TaxID=41117 RepID=UPI00188507D5|nr:uncharacterized protein LOC119102725 [Pollicipes pollicipes]
MSRHSLSGPASGLDGSRLLPAAIWSALRAPQSKSDTHRTAATFSGPPTPQLTHWAAHWQGRSLRLDGRLPRLAADLMQTARSLDQQRRSVGSEAMFRTTYTAADSLASSQPEMLAGLLAGSALVAMAKDGLASLARNASAPDSADSESDRRISRKQTSSGSYRRHSQRDSRRRKTASDSHGRLSQPESSQMLNGEFLSASSSEDRLCARDRPAHRYRGRRREDPLSDDTSGSSDQGDID